MDSLLTLDDRSKRALEWERLKGFVADEALSVVSKNICLELELNADIEQIQNALDETEETLSLLENRSSLLVDSIPDVREVLVRISHGMRVPTDELLSIKEVLSITKKVRGSLKLLSSDTFPQLTNYSLRLDSLDGLRRELEKCIDEKGAIKDDASSDLRRIRKNTRKLHSTIKEDLHKLIHSPKISKALQETIITQRNGRYVIPVLSNQRSVVNGIVHDTSQSGLTVYVEPISVVESTNKIRILEAEEEYEIERIISNLCRLCKDDCATIETDFETLTSLDVVQAKAKIAHKYNGIKPELTNDDTINLVEAKHPLLVLQGDNVVANSLTLGGEERTLVITGPNTGGKTVLLKQVGLTSIMVKAGLLICAKAGSQVSIFDRIWADIGDEQSLEQSLSTFSSHLQNVVSIVNGAGKGILILLDEIGVGTDPKEGAAIAQSVLEHLNQSGALTISTTHYTDLKLLAYSEAGFINGSLDFDESTFAPTYKLRLGVPGSSKGIVIADRLGLRSSVTQRAKLILDSKEDDASQLMQGIESRISKIQEQEKELEEGLADVQSEKTQLLKAKEEVKKSKAALETGYAEQLKKDFDDTEKLIKQMTRDLQKTPSLKKTQAIKSKLEKAKKDVKWLSEPHKKPSQNESKPNADSLKIGQKVKVLSLNQTGSLDSIQSKSSDGSAFEAMVKVGHMKVKVNESEIKVLDERGFTPKKRRKLPGNYKPEPTNESRALEAFIRTSSNTIDLRGKRVEEAMFLVDKFLDDCLVSSTSPVMIIHGHGTGAIKEAVRGHLKSSRFSKSFRPGEMYEGGDGVTVVDL